MLTNCRLVGGGDNLKIGDRFGIILPGKIPPVTSMVCINFDWSIYSNIFIFNSVDVTLFRKLIPAFTLEVYNPILAESSYTA